MSDDTIKAPAPRPCGSCPYRRDVPSGVWSREEYEKLPPFDNDTAAQPASVFMCHQQDGRVCAGWAGCHNMEQSFGVRLAAFSGLLPLGELDALLDYTTDVPLFQSGGEAAAHGLAQLDAPDEKAVRVIDKLAAKRERT